VLPLPVTVASVSVSAERKLEISGGVYVNDPEPEAYDKLPVPAGDCCDTLNNDVSVALAPAPAAAHDVPFHAYTIPATVYVKVPSVACPPVAGKLIAIAQYAPYVFYLFYQVVNAALFQVLVATAMYT
jgi:hypothetical protein